MVDSSEFSIPTPQELRELRHATGLTMREAAERADVATDSIRRWEHGIHSPRICDARKLLELYADEYDGG